MSTTSVDGSLPLIVKVSNVVKLFDSGCDTLDLLPMKVVTMCWTLGWVCLLVAEVVDSADEVMFHHLSWESDGETRGGKDGWMPATTAMTACKGLWASAIMFMYTSLFYKEFELICHDN